MYFARPGSENFSGERVLFRSPKIGKLGRLVRFRIENVSAPKPWLAFMYVRSKPGPCFVHTFILRVVCMCKTTLST